MPERNLDIVMLVGKNPARLEADADAIRARGVNVLGPYAFDQHKELDQISDCAVVDLSSGNGTGRRSLAALCQSLAPLVLVITAAADTETRVAALRLGASDHIVAPYDRDELIARVEVLLARRRRLRRDRLSIGDVTVAVPERRVMRDGVELSLTQREFDVLVVLMAARGTVVSKMDLLRDVWKDDGHNVNLVEAHVSALRRKLETAGGPVIVTVHGRGYAFRPARRALPASRDALINERDRLLRERDDAIRRRDELIERLRTKLDRGGL